MSYGANKVSLDCSGRLILPRRNDGYAYAREGAFQFSVGY